MLLFTTRLQLVVYNQLFMTSCLQPAVYNLFLTTSCLQPVVYNQLLNIQAVYILSLSEVREDENWVSKIGLPSNISLNPENWVHKG